MELQLQNVIDMLKSDPGGFFVCIGLILLIHTLLMRMNARDLPATGDFSSQRASDAELQCFLCC